MQVHLPGYWLESWSADAETVLAAVLFRGKGAAGLQQVLRTCITAKAGRPGVCSGHQTEPKSPAGSRPDCA
eukprot:3106985-Rhodomonas_salina.1